MTNRARAVVATAALGLTAPVAFACPGMYACVPSACLIQQRAAVRNPTGPGTPNAGLNSTAANMSLLSQLSLAQMPGVGGQIAADGSSLYAWVDPLTNKEYALMGRSNGTSVVDVTNPTQPKYVANIPSAGSNTLWREPKVYQNYAYVGVDGGSHRMQIVDLTQVRNYAGTTMQLSYGTYTGASITNIHTVAINKDTGYLYLSGTGLNSGAPHIVDVRNPAAPVPAGNVPGGVGFDGYSHESQVVIYNGPDVAHRGKEIMVSSNGKQSATPDTLSIVNVTNKATPQRLSSKTYAGAGYIHQGWFTEDQRYFFQNDELESSNLTRTHMWDLQDLDNPVYRGYFQNPSTTAIAHNLYVKGNYVYEANYTTGVRVLKLGNLESTNPADWLIEVASYDTYAPSDADTFNGAWNIYPYLPSGNILVSDIDGGLFVLRANLPSEGPPIGDFIKPPRLGDPTPFVPEPGAIGLFAVAGAGMLVRRRGAR